METWTGIKQATNHPDSVALRTADEVAMHVISGLHNDVCHHLDGSGAYEWWYADALDESAEWGVVAILFRGMPMSPDYLANPAEMHAGYALSVYHRGVRVAFAFGRHVLEESTFSQDCLEVRMPSAMMVQQGDAINVHVDAPCGNDGRRARVEMRLHVPEKLQSVGEPFAERWNHGWVLAGPRLTADVSIQIHEQHGCVVDETFTATAYHDHNMGRRAMSADFGDWYWGRVHAKDQTFVYLITQRSADNVTWFGRVHHDGRIESFSDVKVHMRDRRISLMGLTFYRTVQVSGVAPSGEQVRVTCENRHACEDGPFYQRYLSRWQLEGSDIGTGMSEYMDVQRLAKPWIRPFLRLPWVVSS